MSKILVPKTDYLVEINEVVRAISILGNPNWEITLADGDCQSSFTEKELVRDNLAYMLYNDAFEVEEVEE